MSVNTTSTTSSAVIPIASNGQACNPNEVMGPPAKMSCVIPLAPYNNYTNNTELLQSCCFEPVYIVGSCNLVCNSSSRTAEAQVYQCMNAYSRNLSIWGCEGSYDADDGKFSSSGGRTAQNHGFGWSGLLGLAIMALVFTIL